MAEGGNEVGGGKVVRGNQHRLVGQSDDIGCLRVVARDLDHLEPDEGVAVAGGGMPQDRVGGEGRNSRLEVECGSHRNADHFEWGEETGELRDPGGIRALAESNEHAGTDVKHVTTVEGSLGHVFYSHQISENRAHPNGFAASRRMPGPREDRPASKDDGCILDEHTVGMFLGRWHSDDVESSIL